MAPRPDRRVLRPLVGDLRQYASVRRIVLDDGPERGVRALAFSTGGGLDFWLMADRSLDIGPLWWRGSPVAWQGVNAFRAPALHDAESENGQGFARGFSGFLVTCGLDHTRQPANGHPLHGRLPYTPARLTSYGEDWDREVPILFAEGEIVQGRLHGEVLRLKRRIEAPIGGNRLIILDRVTNDAATPHPQGLLYHMNIGWPAVRDGSRFLLNGTPLVGPLPMPDPSATNLAECFAVPSGDTAECALVTPGSDLCLTVAFDTSTLPYLQIWRDTRPNTHVVGIEPCTSTRLEGGLSGTEPLLEPGGTRVYRVEVRFDTVAD
jgi:hypothetical protein